MARPSHRKPQRNSVRETSLGSALDEIGFKPLGRRIKIKVGIDQGKLRRRPSASSEQRN